MPLKGLILAGGHGTRLRPLTFTGNKHMLPLANKPILLYSIEDMIRMGIRDIGIILGPIKESIPEYFGDGSKFGVRITYIDQPEPKGLAHAIIVAEEFLGNDSFVMYLGDNLLKNGALEFLNKFKDGNYDCVIGVAQVKNPQQYGIVEMDNGKIKRFVEKPKQPAGNLAVVGVYVFNNKIIEAVHKIKPSWRNELEILDAISVLLNGGLKIGVHEVQGWWKDTGKPDDLLEANQLILQNIESRITCNVPESTRIVGNVAMGEGTMIYENCYLQGPIVIGSNCKIGPNAYIGPYTSVGNGSQLSECQISNSMIMDNVSIESDNMISDSIIASNSKITNARKNLPKFTKLVLGERSFASF